MKIKLLAPLLIISILALLQGCGVYAQRQAETEARVAAANMEFAVNKFKAGHLEYIMLIQKHGLGEIDKVTLAHKMNSSYLTDDEKVLYRKGVIGWEECCKRLFMGQQSGIVLVMLDQLVLKLGDIAMQLLQDEITIGEAVKMRVESMMNYKQELVVYRGQQLENHKSREAIKSLKVPTSQTCRQADDKTVRCTRY